MSVKSVETDPERLTLTLIAEFDAPPEQVWELWADARKLERWWGPPGYPATFERHALEPGGETSYYMTGPDGKRYPGWWRVEAVEPPRSIEFRDGFADDEGRPTTDMPVTTARVLFSAREDGGTRMEMRSVFASRADLDKVSEMGMEEGLRQAAEQMDGVLAG